MNMTMGKLETGLTVALWLAAALLLPLAALTPLEGGGAQAKLYAAAACFSNAVDMLRACPATAL